MADATAMIEPSSESFTTHPNCSPFVAPAKSPTIDTSKFKGFL
jgi:hypothetical protein